MKVINPRPKRKRRKTTKRRKTVKRVTRKRVNPPITPAQVEDIVNVIVDTYTKKVAASSWYRAGLLDGLTGVAVLLNRTKHGQAATKLLRTIQGLAVKWHIEGK